MPLGVSELTMPKVKRVRLCFVKGCEAVEEVIDGVIVFELLWRDRGKEVEGALMICD